MIESYIDCIPGITAERRILIASGASLPNMKDPETTMSRWIEEAYGDEMQKEAASPAMLKLIGIGVEHARKSR